MWTPGLTLTSDYPASCALRIKKGQDKFDPSWKLDFAKDVTDGREAGIMRYLGDGKALLDVFHAERVKIDDDTDAEELVNTPNWRLWTIDLEDKSGGPMDGLNDDYSETTAYEIEDGEAVEGFKIKGSSYHMVQVR